MSFSLSAIEPAGDAGRRFDCSIWEWLPLWEFVGERCRDILDDEDVKFGFSNDGYVIESSKAVAIGERLQTLIDSDEVGRCERLRDIARSKLEKVSCTLCHGKGVVLQIPTPIRCIACSGTGQILPTEGAYVFTEGLVRRFVTFSLLSGGFEIW